MQNEEIMMPTYLELSSKLENEDYVIDKTGSKLVEIINHQIKNLNPLQPVLEFNGRKTPVKYCEKELKWYNSKNLNIKGYVDDIKIWNDIADKDGFVNSNYGWCIYSKENYKQYDNCLNTLKNNKESRRAVMIYTRPSMQYDYKTDGMNEFMCTYGTQHFIRNNKLKTIYILRSNDGIYGWMNDWYWAANVHNKLYADLLQYYPKLEVGTVDWNAASFHVYARHFDMLKKIVTTNTR